MDEKLLIGKRIKSAREELNYTQLDIANELGMNKSTIQRYETGKVDNIKLPVIEAIAKFLQVNPAWLVGKSDTKEIKKIPSEKSEEIEEGIVLHRDGKTSTYRMSKEKLKTIEALLNQLDEDDNPDL